MPSESTDPANAAFFGLAFRAALNPKLPSADLLISENRRPGAMFICFLAGRLGMSIPTARTHQIEDAGHAAPFDATSNFVRLIADTITSERCRTFG